MKMYDNVMTYANAMHEYDKSIIIYKGGMI